MGDRVELKLTHGPVAAFNVDKIELGVGAGTGLTGAAGTNGTDGIDGESPTATNIGAVVAGADAKATPVDADSLGLSDSSAAGILKKLTWANLKATLKTYFDTLYAIASHALSTHSDMIVKAQGNFTGAVTIDYADGLYHTFTVTGNITGITWSNLPTGPWSMILEITNGGAFTIAWGTFTVPGGTLTLTAAGVDKVVVNGRGSVASVGLAHEDLS